MGRRILLDSEAYELKKGIADFLTRTANQRESHQIIQIPETESTPYIYYQGRLMVEYLLDVKGMSCHEILQDSATEASVYQEMIVWYNQQQD